MAESIEEAIDWVNRELNEETMRQRGLGGPNKEAIRVFAERLQIDGDDLIKSLTEYGSRVLKGDKALIEWGVKMMLSGYFYGVRWEQARCRQPIRECFIEKDGEVRTYAGPIRALDMIREIVDGDA